MKECSGQFYVLQGKLATKVLVFPVAGDATQLPGDSVLPARPPLPKFLSTKTTTPIVPGMARSFWTLNAVRIILVGLGRTLMKKP